MLRIKKWLYNKIARYPFGLLVEPIVLKINKDRKVLLNGQELTEEQVTVLAEEAREILETRLWQHVLNATTYGAVRHIVEQGATEYDMIWDKAIIHSVREMDRFMKKLATYS